MKSPIAIDVLEIVGFANVLLDTMLPSIVPPIFRLKGNNEELYVPPYMFNAGHLCNATVISHSELMALQSAQEVTLFDTKPFAAGRDFELWLDLERKPHYKPRGLAHEALLVLAKKYIQKAEEALENGNMTDAERFSSIALCADDRLIKPLAIKAAICRINGDSSGEKLMAKLSAPRLCEDDFRRLVDPYYSKTPSNRTDGDKAYKTPSDLSSTRPMRSVAALHPA